MTTPTEKANNTPPPAGTTTRQVGRSGPRQPPTPHERDESASSQEDPGHGIIEQARQDIESGQQDTDRRGTPGLEKPERRPP